MQHHRNTKRLYRDGSSGIHCSILLPPSEDGAGADWELLQALSKSPRCLSTHTSCLLSDFIRYPQVWRIGKLKKRDPVERSRVWHQSSRDQELRGASKVLASPFVSDRNQQFPVP